MGIGVGVVRKYKTKSHSIKNLEIIFLSFLTLFFKNNSKFTPFKVEPGEIPNRGVFCHPYLDFSIVTNFKMLSNLL